MKKRSILVVDGEKNIRSTMQKSLETEGTSVFTAVNAEEALETLQRNPFDLVFLDLNVHSTPITIINGRIS
ncbi:MAG: response regulator [Desulfococcaceae bacterium]